MSASISMGRNQEYLPYANSRVQLFEYGECVAFAVALHQEFGWPLVAIIKDWEKLSARRNVICHVGVRTPDGRICDMRGVLREADFARYHSAPFRVKEVSLNELKMARTVNPESVKHSRVVAERLWPDWPWLRSRK